MKMKISFVFVIFISVFRALPASATPLSWSLSGGFSLSVDTDLEQCGPGQEGCGTFTGRFTYDASTNIVSNWRIMVTSGVFSEDGVSLFPPFTYSPSDSSASANVFPITSTENGIGFAFVAPLSDHLLRVFSIQPDKDVREAGGTIAIQPDPSQEYFSGGGALRHIDGFLKAIPVPESGSLFLIFSELGILSAWVGLKKLKGNHG